MKIIQALKELPLIEKKLHKNQLQIAIYASSIDAGTVRNTLKFATKEIQDQTVQSLLQSSADLIALRASIRRQLSFTNATTKVTIGGVERTITEWIEYRKHGIGFMSSAFSALSDRSSMQEMGTIKVDGIQGVKVVRHYDEATKNDQLSKLLEMPTQIDVALEIVNATTDLIEGE